MSNFLTRLAQRQLGQIATIEPRLPGSYAPVIEEAKFRDIGFGFEHQPVTEVTDVTQDAVAVARKSSTLVPTKDPVLPLDSSTSLPAMRHQLLSRDHQQIVNRPHQIEVKAGDENTPQSNKKQLPVEVSTTPSQKLSVEQRPAGLSSEEQPELPAGEPPPIEKRGFVAEEKTSSQVRFPLPVPSLLVERKESDRLDAPAPLYGLKEPAVVPRRAMLIPERTIDAAEQPVRVTIGRVEVTALTGVAPPKRAPVTRKPSMSLDDYLARRQRRDR